MVSVNSNLIGTATSPVARTAKGGVKGSWALYECAALLADNSVVVLDSIPVDAVIMSIGIATDDLGTTGLMNVGLYPDTAAIRAKVTAGTLADTDAVDEDCFATSIDVNAAAVALTENLFEVGATSIDKATKKAWERAGLSAKPAYNNFLLCITMAEATTAATGTIVARTSYIA